MTLIADVLDWQYDVITCQAKFMSLMAGRRAGKTHALKCRIINDSLYNPGNKILYLTPSGTLCNEIFEELCSDKYLRRRIKRIVKQPMRKITFYNGSEVYVTMWQGDPEKLRGLGFDLVILDEIQSLESLQDRDKLLMIVRPLLMDRQGKFIISGQYRGKRCWWYKWFDENAGDPNYETWSIPSWKGWLFKDEGYNHPEIQLALKTLPKAVFDQEIACIPSANQNAAFQYDDIMACTVGKKEKIKKNGRYVIGVDLGRTVDPSAWVGIDLNTGSVVHAELRRIGERHEIGAKALGDLAAKLNNAEVFIDTTGGATGGKKDIDAYVKFYRNRLPSMRPVQMQRKNKERLIQNLALAIEQHEIYIPEEFDTLISQLEQYEYKEDKWGNFSYSGPNGHEDDYCIALALALEGYRLGSYGTKNQN